jgi:D-alanyl-lipoteichoic acid acyltransferase DltB (MBOAT superfamily)
MLFNSHVFIFVFLPATLIGFFLLGRLRQTVAARLWLVAMSLVFYAWWGLTQPEPSLAPLLLLVGSKLANYVVGRQVFLMRLSAPKAATRLLALGIVGNLALLAYFKYTFFILQNISALTGLDFAIGAIVLPLGISFFTFQQIAYLVDARNGEAETRSLIDYFAFVSFFPQLIAGPIVHHRELMPQLRDPKIFRFNADDFAAGLAFFVIGLMKKVLIADRLRPLHADVFAAGADPPSLIVAWTAALAYTVGLYFDFSGYSDMAVGLARMFGVRLPFNFASPYKATSIIEFWRRWHMTLSRWLRDYLYVPLGGNRKGAFIRHRNLVITMLLGGLWHGAAWTFVIWGALHGLYLLINHAWREMQARARIAGRAVNMPNSAAQGLTFFAVVVAWVFFASPSLPQAVTVLSGMSGAHGLLGADLAAWWGAISSPAQLLQQADDRVILLAIALGIVFFCPNTQELIDRDNAVNAAIVRPIWRPNAAWGALAGIGFLLVLSVMADVQEFVYFQF